MDSIHQRRAKRERQERQREARNDMIAMYAGAGTLLSLFTGGAVLAIQHGTEELSSPGVAREAVLNSGYSNPRHIGVPAAKECRTGARYEGRYYRDAFQAVAPNGRKVNLIVCRAERSSASSVRVSASARYRY